jgi:crotonobetainyl-CoA:carnitine CoA-transferase CaiB-like acyl-CoA transferase
MDKPLAGIKVLELATFVAAPCGTRLLADLGATVIKVESPSGDAWRKTGISYLPRRFSEDENPVFDIYNAGKKHIAINLKTPEGMEVFHKLLSESDVFVTNNRPQSLKKLGLTYEDLKDKYPKLIYGIVLGYGEKGPDAAKPAFDTTAFWTRTGFIRDLAIAGEHYKPIYPPSSVGDTFTGTMLMGEICAALYRRLLTGKGDYVRSSLYHNGIFAMGTMTVTTQRPYGQVFPKDRATHSVTGGYFKCSDGDYLYIAIGNVEMTLPAMCKAIDRLDLLDDPVFMTALGRWENRYKYYQIFEDAFLKKTCKEWLKIGEELDIPMIRLNHFADVNEDEQAWANGYLEHVEFASGRTGIMPASPIEMDSIGEIKTIPAKKIGANSEEILLELGYSEEQIKNMNEKGSVL